MTKPKNKAKRRAYPEKYRKKRAVLIQKTRPWTKTTGPKTDSGKAKSAQNAAKTGLHNIQIRWLRSLLRLQKRQLRLHAACVHKFLNGSGTAQKTRDTVQE